MSRPTSPQKLVTYQFAGQWVDGSSTRIMAAQWISGLSPLMRHALEVRYHYYATHAAQHRWEHAHDVPYRTGGMDAMCAWCAETIAYDVPFNPRHADSEQEAIAICHGLVEYHITNGCEVHQRVMEAMAAERSGGHP